MNKLLAILLLSSLLSACASGPGRPIDSNDGFIDDFSRLEQFQGKENVLYWLNPQLQQKQYRHIILNPVINLVDNAKHPALVNDSAQYITEQLWREFKQQGLLSNSHADDTITLSMAITHIGLVQKGFSAWDILPARLLIDATKNATGLADAELVVIIEIRVTDSESKQAVAEVVMNLRGDKTHSSSSTVTLETLKPELDLWIKEIANNFEQPLLRHQAAAKP
ncbi:uncharacterized protein DUF3313 [Sinobacterium caligoides]|uniref:Uncharacterized protein DUF3313 n=1 Tax=Sinobacterium caligoides TaxID=933926 RepID=A0A3N2DQI1_9GAMM|nr:DUF3313 family protein [Sinobacterium caligoides]ROS02063.1 uncharacterized protein DUF3313 [Sinobacterium caligoides]